MYPLGARLPNLSAPGTGLGTHFHHFGPQKVSLPRSAERIMARNFGVPQRIRSGYRPSLWPLLAVTFVMVGMIDVATHLRHW
jgi:hypothetical protein